MKGLEKMTRKELAEVIVNEQIKRGIVKKEDKDIQIKARLNGIGGLKAMSKSELYKGAKAFLAYKK